MKSNSKSSESETNKMFKSLHNKQPPVQQPPPLPDQLTPNSSSSPYTITSSLSSSSSSLQPSVPPLPVLQPPQAKKNSKQSSLLSLKSVESTQSNKSSFSVCSSQKCFISIWSTWYCLLVTGLHVYLIHNRIIDIVNLFSINADLLNKTESNNTIGYKNTTINMNQMNANVYFELVSRLCLVTLSIIFLILFLLCSLKPLGNYSNDGIKFGRDFFYEKIHHNHLDHKKRQKKKSRSCLANLFGIIWRHFLPANSFCHLVLILLLIFSRIIFDDSIKTSHNYSSIKECLTNKQLSTWCLSNFFLVQVNQSTSLFVNADDTNPNIFYLVEQISIYKFELISICLAFISIYIRYGSVFWFTNKFLSFLITFIGFIAAIEQLLQLYSFIYIYNQLNLNEQVYWAKLFLKENSSFATSTETTTISLVQAESQKSFLNTFAASFEFTFLIKNKITLLFLYFTLSVLVYLSATPAYVFSFLKYKERFTIEESLFVRTILNRNKKDEESSISSSCSSSVDEQARLPTSTYKFNKHETDQNVNSTCCFNYCPHLIATIQLVLICASKLPFCYDYVIYFNQYKDFGICLVIIVEILHTIMLIFIWLLLTLKTEWTMHLQTAFSICHWTYHLKMKKSDDPTAKYPNKAIRAITGSELVAGETKKEATESGNSYMNRKSVDFSDYNANSGFKAMNNYDQSKVAKSNGNNFSNLLAYQHQTSEPTKHVTNIMIRNNPNNNNIYGSCNNQRQNMIETKHKSMIERYEDNNIYSTNANSNLDEILSSKPQLSGGNDYLLNSETLYRNEIRKSIRNIMQQKRCSNSALLGSSATLVTSASMAHLLNQQNKQSSFEQHKTSEPYFYQSENGKKRLIGGVYLTSTTPTVIDNSTTKIPTITHIVTSTICSTTNNPRQIDQNKNRSVLYLERRSSSSNEYESRV